MKSNRWYPLEAFATPKAAKETLIRLRGIVEEQLRVDMNTLQQGRVGGGLSETDPSTMSDEELDRELRLMGVE